jgi:hypothetical protein
MIVIIIVGSFYSQDYGVSRSPLNTSLHCLHIPYKNHHIRITIRLSTSKNITIYKYRTKRELSSFKPLKNTIYNQI